MLTNYANFSESCQCSQVQFLLVKGVYKATSAVTKELLKATSTHIERVMIIYFS
jgi:hypothetical protein